MFVYALAGMVAAGIVVAFGVGGFLLGWYIRGRVASPRRRAHDISDEQIKLIKQQEAESAAMVELMKYNVNVAYGNTDVYAMRGDDS